MGRPLREFHSFQRARDAFFAILRMTEGRVERSAAQRKTFTVKVHELFADLLDESLDTFAAFFVKQLLKGSAIARTLPRATLGIC